MPWGVSRRVEHDHASVAEDVHVAGHGFVLPAAAHPMREWSARCGRSLRIAHDVPVALADEQGRTREKVCLSGVVRVIMADPDELHLLGLRTDLLGQSEETRL